MKTTRSNPVIMPNSEQSEHTSRKGAMNGQVRPENAVPIFHGTTGSDSLIPCSQTLGHHYLQQAMPLLREIAHAIGHRADLSHQSLLLGQRGLGRSSSCSFSLGRTLCLPPDYHQAVLFGFHRTIEASLDLRGDMEEMPDISLVVLLPMNLTQGVLDGSASITDRPQTADPLFLQIPQKPRPTFPIDLHRGHAGPDLPAVHIHYIQIGFSALAAVLFIQCQGAGSRGLLVVQPALGTVSGFFDDDRDLPQAQIDPMHASQTGLNASITRMRFDQQRQDQCLNRGGLLRSNNPASQGFFQRSDSSRCPTRQRLTRDIMGPTQLTDPPMAGLRHHPTDHFNKLLNSATMDLASSLKTVQGFLFFSPYLSGMLFVN